VERRNKGMRLLGGGFGTSFLREKLCTVHAKSVYLKTN
jgi:hypothetical protein